MTMAYMMAQYLLSYDEWTSGNIIVKLKNQDEFFKVNSISIDENNDFVIEVSNRRI